MEPLQGRQVGKAALRGPGAAEHAGLGTPAAGWAFRFAAGLEGVEMVLSGMNTRGRCWKNTAVLKAPVPLEEEEQALLEQAARLLRQSELVACTAAATVPRAARRRSPSHSAGAL